MAGFIDGEGSFFISYTSENKTKFRPKFSLAIRADDRPIVDELRAATGIGTVHEYKATSSGNTVVRWMIQSHADCEALVRLLDSFPLRAKKRKDFDVWRRAVAEASTLSMGCKADNADTYRRIKALKDELALVRREGIR